MPDAPSSPRLAGVDVDELERRRDDVPSQITVSTAIARTILRHPDLARGYMPFGVALRDGALPARARELAILRTARLCDCPYQWARHVDTAREAGVTDADMEAIGTLEMAPSWNEFDRAFVAAADELHATSTLSDETWAVLRRHLADHELIELLMLIGNYTMLAFVMNGVALAPEAGDEWPPASWA